MSDVTIPDPAPVATQGPGILECDAVTRWYGQVIGINDVNLDVSTGVVGLLGPNGAGKTTAFYMIVGLIAADSGNILLLSAASVWEISVSSRLKSDSS